MSSMSRVSRYMLRLMAWSIHFWARAATSRNAYGDSWKLVLYDARMSSGISVMPWMSPWLRRIDSRVRSHRPCSFSASTRLRLTSRNLPELVERLKICENCGSRPGVVPATRPMDAVGAIAMRVALRTPPFTRSRSASQSRRVVRLTCTSMPRSASVRSIVSKGTRPCDQRLPSKLS